MAVKDDSTIDKKSSDKKQLRLTIKTDFNDEEEKEDEILPLETPSKEELTSRRNTAIGMMT